ANPVLAVAVQSGCASRFIVFPDSLAGPFVHGQQNLPLAWSNPKDGQVAIDDGRRRGSPNVYLRPGVLFPQFLALPVVANHSGGAVTGNHSLTVGYGRGRAERIGVVCGFFGLVLDEFVPEQFSIRAVEAHEAALCTLVGGLRDKNAITPNHRRRVAGI